MLICDSVCMKNPPRLATSISLKKPHIKVIVVKNFEGLTARKRQKNNQKHTCLEHFNKHTVVSHEERTSTLQTIHLGGGWGEEKGILNITMANQR